MAHKTCQRCGTELRPDVPGGLCPRCLVQAGIDLSTGAGPNADASFGDAGDDILPEQPDLMPSVAKPECPAPALAGRSFGDYELLEEIARGGMGVVWKARQRSLNRIVALKVMLSGQFAQPEFVQRFRAEAEAIAQLQHPNIVAIHEVGDHEGQPYFSMDFVEGRTLAEIVREGPLPAKRAATYLKSIADAVHYAHQHGILHRDLKPSNVLIDATDQPRITDFGLAKRLVVPPSGGGGAGKPAEAGTTNDLTLAGQVLGSPNYLSPEQAAGKQAEVGRASDVYALGAMLYHLVTGRPPFQADSLTTLLGQVMEAEPVAPRLLNASIPRDLETICLKCLEKDRQRRYATAQALADELGRFLRSEPILARPVSRPEKVWRWCRRKPALATALGAVVLVAAIGFAGIVSQWRRAEQQRRNAESSELFARQNAYAADMNLAQRALEANDVRLAVSLLNKHRPEFGVPASAGAAHKTAAEYPDRVNAGLRTDLRHWEWRYLWQLCQPDESIKLQTNPASIGQVAFSQDGIVMAVQTGGDKIAVWNLTTKRLMTELRASPTVESLRLSRTGNLLAVSIRTAQGKPAVEVWDVPARKISSTLNLRSPVKSLAFSPDGTLLASFDNKGTVAVVDWATNHTLTNLSVPPPRHGNAGVVDFSPDGSRLAIGEDYGRIRILNWRTGTMVAMTNLTQGGEGVGAMAFSPSSELLATGFGNTIRLWDASSGEPQGQLTNHIGSVRALAFSADGQRLASAGSDRTIRIWSVADQVELRCLRGHASEGMALAFLPDGKTLVSGCGVGTACLWDVTSTNRPSCHTSLPISLGPGVQTALSPESFEPGTNLNRKVVRRFGFTFTPDGRSFITTDPDGSLGLWDARSVQRKESLPALGSNNWGVALSPDGHWLAVGNASGKVNIWDWRERHRVASFEAPFEWFGLLRFTRSGRFLWATVMFNDWTIRCRIWRTEDWQEVPLTRVQVADIWSADLSPGDRFLAAGYANGAVKLWDFPSGRLRTTFTNQTGSVWAVLFSPDGRMLASTSFDGTVILRDLFAHREVATLRGHPAAVGGAALSPDGRRLVTGGLGSKDAVRLWDLTTQRELLSLQGEGELIFAHVAFSPDGSTLMATSFAGIANLWRAPSWAEIEAVEKGAGTP